MASADFHIKRNDTSPEIKSQLEDESGNPVDISTYNEVEFHMKDPTADTAKVDADTASGVTVLNASEGKVSYQWSDGDTDVEGRFHAEWEVTYDDGGIETYPNTDYIEVRILEDLS